jgi:hypothetical protein
MLVGVKFVESVHHQHKAEQDGEYEKRVTNSVDLPPFRSLLKRVAAAVPSRPQSARAPMQPVPPLDPPAPGASPTPLLRLLSGESMMAPSNSSATTTTTESRPLSRPLVETLALLTDASICRATQPALAAAKDASSSSSASARRPGSAVVRAPLRGSEEARKYSRPSTAAARRPAAATATVQQQLEVPGRRAEEESKEQQHHPVSLSLPAAAAAGEAGPRVAAARPVPVLGSGTTGDNDTFLTSLTGYGAETEMEAKQEPEQPQQLVLASNSENGDNNIFGDFLAPSPKLQQQRKIDATPTVAVGEELLSGSNAVVTAQSQAGVFSSWVPFSPRSSSVSMPLHPASSAPAPDEDESQWHTLQMHPSLHVPCETVPPTRASALRRRVPTRGVTLTQQLAALEQRGAAQTPQSWGWFARLVAPEPSEGAVKAASLIPSRSKQQLLLHRAANSINVLLNVGDAGEETKEQASWLIVADAAVDSEPQRAAAVPAVAPSSQSAIVSPRPRSAPGARRPPPAVPALQFDSLPPGQVVRPFRRSSNNGGGRLMSRAAKQQAMLQQEIERMAQQQQAEQDALIAAALAPEPSMRPRAQPTSSSPLFLSSADRLVTRLGGVPAAFHSATTSSAYPAASVWDGPVAEPYLRDAAPRGMRYARGETTGDGNDDGVSINYPSAAHDDAVDGVAAARSRIRETLREVATEQARMRSLGRPSSSRSRGRSSSRPQSALPSARLEAPIIAADEAYQRRMARAAAIVTAAQAPLMQQSSRVLERNSIEPSLATLPLSLPLPQSMPLRLSTQPAGYSRFAIPSSSAVAGGGGGAPEVWWPGRGLAVHKKDAATSSKRQPMSGRPQSAHQGVVRRAPTRDFKEIEPSSSASAATDRDAEEVQPIDVDTLGEHAAGEAVPRSSLASTSASNGDVIISPQLAHSLSDAVVTAEVQQSSASVASAKQPVRPSSAFLPATSATGTIAAHSAPTTASAVAPETPLFVVPPAAAASFFSSTAGKAMPLQISVRELGNDDSSSDDGRDGMEEAGDGISSWSSRTVTAAAPPLLFQSGAQGVLTLQQQRYLASRGVNRTKPSTPRSARARADVVGRQTAAVASSTPRSPSSSPTRLPLHAKLNVARASSPSAAHSSSIPSFATPSSVNKPHTSSNSSRHSGGALVATTAPSSVSSPMTNRRRTASLDKRAGSAASRGARTSNNNNNNNNDALPVAVRGSGFAARAAQDNGISIDYVPSSSTYSAELAALEAQMATGRADAVVVSGIFDEQVAAGEAIPDAVSAGASTAANLRSPVRRAALQRPSVPADATEADFMTV